MTLFHGMIRFVYPAAPAVLVLLIACSSGNSDASPTPTAGPTAGPTATPALGTPTVGPTATDLPVAEIVAGEAADFPDRVALIVETGCWGCDGPTTGLVRVYRRPDGSIAQDILFIVEQLDLPDDGDNAEPRIIDFEIRHDASEIVVTVCVTGFCGGLAPVAPGDSATLYRSTDGGVTWVESGDWPLDHWMIGLLPDGVLAGHQTNIGASTKPDNPSDAPFATQVPPEYEFAVLPAGRLLVPPAGANPAVWPVVWPVVTESGEVWWSADDGRFLRDDGSVALTFPASVSQASNPRGHPKSEIAVSWYSDDVDGQLLSFYSGDSRQSEDRELEYVTTVSGVTHVGPINTKDGYLYAGSEAYASSVSLPTPWTYGLIPAMIDLQTHTAHPLVSPFLDGTLILPNGRNRIVAFQRGPFARVITPGSCLNLRAEPSLSAEILDCLANGVLLFADSRTTEIDGVTWLEVLHTASFPHGWVSTGFLER